MILPTDNAAASLPAGDKGHATPIHCGWETHPLIRPFRELSTIHRAYYNYYGYEINPQ